MSRARLAYSIHIGAVLVGRIRIMHLMCAHENLMECGESAKFENFADLQTLMLSTIAHEVKGSELKLPSC
jgi:hypothetical protein